MDKTIEFLKKYIVKKTVVIGCSGGPDSMALLHILINNFQDTKIICAHVNHNIRKESKDELEFVKDYCHKNNITFVSTVLPNDKKYNEVELRKMRYKFFESTIKEYKADYLLTAHHNDDLIETILMRINRGSILKGYAGIEECTSKKDYKILRPLLSYNKEHIMAYIKDNKIPYVIDESNNTDDYTRNRYRHHILPFLKEEGNNIEDKYLKYSRELLEYYKFVNNIVLEELNENYSNSYNLKKYYKFDKLIQRKIIEKILDINYPNNLDLLNDKHVIQIMELINNKSNGIVMLPNNKVIEKSYDELILRDNTNNDITYDYILEESIDIPTGSIFITKDDSDSSNYCLKINSKDIKLPLHVRTRKDGDKIEVKNLNGSKKVKDILIDEKVIASKRNLIPVVTDDNNTIIWLPGIKKSKFDKSKSENYDIIIKYEEVSKKEKYYE